MSANFRPRSFSIAIVSALAAAVLLAGCGAAGSDGSAEGMLASAKSYLSQHDPQAARVQLKNALQKNPDSAEARFLLGRIEFDAGDMVSAAVELRRALALKYDASRTLPLLARAWVATRQFKVLTDAHTTTALAEPAAAADLKTSLAIAYISQGEAARGQAALDAAFAALPEYPRALLLQARIEAEARRFDAAAASVERALAAAPNDADAWQYRGDVLLSGRADPAAALAAYRKALELQPAHVGAHASVVSLLLAQNDLPGAAAQIAALRRAAPKNPQTAYAEAEYAVAAGELDKARTLIQQLLKVAPESVKLLQLAGTLQLRSGALLEAERSFGKVVQLAPELPLPRRLLAQAQLRSGQADKALATLQPLLAAAEPDGAVFALAAEAQLQRGDTAQAEANFTHAARLNPDDRRSRIALALAQVAQGQGDAGLAALQSIATADSDAQADMALAALAIGRGDYPRALQAIDRIAAKQPGQALAEHLRGRVHLLRNEPGEARRSFERALVLAPSYVAASTALAALDVGDGRPDVAAKRFDAILAAEPNNVEALIALAGLRARGGAPAAEVATLLGNAVRAKPAEVAPRLLLVEHYLKTKDAQAALRVAQDAVGALPDSAELLDALGRAQLGAGDTQQAIVSFGKLAGLAPASPQAFMRLAGLHLATGKLAETEQNLRRALAVQPDLLQAQRLLLELQIDSQRFDDALQLARAVQKQRPGEPVGRMFEGAVEAGRKNWPAAVALYRQVLKQFPSSEPAMRLDAALRAAGQETDADRLTAGWLAEHAQDAVFLQYQADLALERRQYDAAERRYRGVVALQPDNAVALNNLAWLMITLKKPGAVDTARKALALQPDAPSLMDTLALALAAERQFGAALELQKRALGLAPARPDLRLSLAKLYLQSGDKSAARGELETLARLGTGFASQGEVGALLKTL